MCKTCEYIQILVKIVHGEKSRYVTRCFMNALAARRKQMMESAESFVWKLCWSKMGLGMYGCKKGLGTVKFFLEYLNREY